ncbi:MAG: acetyl-CoA carboxylase biotin carboxylase subunit [Planctomycetes bacterium]|nr:acetyl-CoA carboxylase biotin carboxylase subunit [Planctomycetota bacterium]
MLVANRGEIAVRVIRACRAEGIPCVAVFSDPDRREPHVRMADEAVALGGSAASESYLRMDKVLDAAKRTGADAIHPGYGFLSQNAAFADACDAAGVTFIGPSGDAMRVMGGKVVARRAMHAAGVPIVPGSLDPCIDAKDARRTADAIGYPVMLKASAGGGGKGIRMVSRAEDVEDMYERAAAEAVSSFGNGEIYVEKCILSPRHIEIQVLLDRHGNGVHIGERECSVQRRHQKILEECPANRLPDSVRDAMAGAAVRGALAVGYVNAGTVEFLADDANNFYFLEMNTRLQVEHTVTEMVYGVDIVREQLRVAAGRRLSWQQSDLRPSGHAMEVRICAEDPEQGFFPSAGKIEHVMLPGGPGVRLDCSVWAGQEITLYYDSMLGKLICWGATRDEARQRTIEGLREFIVSGIRTTIPFTLQLLRRPEIIEGRYDTGFLDAHLAEIVGRPSTRHRYAAAVAAALVHRERARRAAASPRPADGAASGGLSPWVTAGRSRLVGDRP